ncbi:WIAG-tail domain [Paenibacillus sp. P26]|nr:WIAG-tail domain [Paenibacillus sp. P26]
MRCAAVQQFGLSAFILRVEDEKTEVILNFDRPFADENYVLVATANKSSCYAVIKQKQKASAVIEMVRTKFSPSFTGRSIG